MTALLLGGCSYLGFGSKKEAKAEATQFDVLQMQRAQWKKLAETGNAEAEYQLGMSYCCGTTSGHFTPTARKWLCKAAVQGHEQAQFQLGRMFGHEVKKRPFSAPSETQFAYMWYDLAAAQGNQAAAGYLNAMAQFMSAKQIAVAQEWEKNPAVAAGCT